MRHRPRKPQVWLGIAGIFISVFLVLVGVPRLLANLHTFYPRAVIAKAEQETLSEGV